MGREINQTSEVGVVGPTRVYPLMSFTARLFREKPLAVLGLAILVVLLLLAGFAKVGPVGIAAFDPIVYQAETILQSPGLPHIFGTDTLGRDIFSRILHGGRVTMLVALVVTGLSLVLGIVIGGASAFIGGKTDLLLQRLVDGWLAFPFIVMAMVMVGVFQDIGQTFFWGMLKVVVSLTLVFGFWNSRVIRGAVIAVQVHDYMDAGKAVGCSNLRIFRFYVLPNIMAPLIVLGTVTIPWVIFTESALSFLGFGIPPTEPSWGRMLFDGSQITSTGNAWWLAIFPGLFIGLAIFATNVLGDGLRDLLDPRLRGT